jgi:hypothetical protein
MVLSAALLALPIPLMADTTYTYTGDPYTTFSSPTLYTTSDFVSGSFTVSAPLHGSLFQATILPTSFDFSDGVYTATPADTVSTGYPLGRWSFTIWTDGNGDITQWLIGFVVYSNNQELVTFGTANGEGVVYDDSASYAGSVPEEDGSNSSAGTWTESTTTDPVVTPEPSSFALLGTGLLGLCGIARRKLSDRRL